MRHLSPTEREQVLAFIQKSQKILAIKYIRHLFNYGLAEAKHDVEQLMLNPNYAPFANEEPIPEHCAESRYKCIEFDQRSQQLFMVTHEGERLQIDPQHPGWQTLMMLFTLRQFNNEQDYLSQIKLIRNAEDLSLMQQRHQHKQLVRSPDTANAMLQIFQWQDKKNNFIIAASTLMIVALCAIFIIGSY